MTYASLYRRLGKDAIVAAAKRLIDLSEIEPTLRAWAAQGSNSVTAAGERIIEAVESKHGIRLEDDDVVAHLRTALRDIADFPKTQAPVQE